MSIRDNLIKIQNTLPEQVSLVAVSKTKPVTDIMEAYEAGQRAFGENKVQEMAQKWEQLPKDIQWHMIGHVQRNKVKYMAPFVHLIHGVDSPRLLAEIDKRAQQHDRIIDCLFQIHIAEEETKFGLDPDELNQLISEKEFLEMKHVNIKGLMGMATFTADTDQIKKEFGTLKSIFDETRKVLPNMDILSMGMSGDYTLAVDHGSTMVRIGSHIFGARN